MVVSVTMQEITQKLQAEAFSKPIKALVQQTDIITVQCTQVITFDWPVMQIQLINWPPP